MSDAPIAAPMSTIAAPITGSVPGSWTFPNTPLRHAHERVAAGGAGCDPDRPNPYAIPEHASPQIPRRGPDRQSHTELSRARAHRILPAIDPLLDVDRQVAADFLVEVAFVGSLAALKGLGHSRRHSTALRWP